MKLGEGRREYRVSPRSRHGRDDFRYIQSGGEAATGVPQVVLKLPFAFSLSHDTNASDFSRAFSTIVYARPGGNADLYLFGPKLSSVVCPFAESPG